MNNTAWLIIAIAFAVLVLFIVLFLLKAMKTLDETNTTITQLREETLSTLADLHKDANVTLHHTNEILAKADVLIDDVNGKMVTIDPLFVAVADLSASVSDLNSSARDLSVRANKATKSTFKAGRAVTGLSLVSKLFKK